MLLGIVMQLQIPDETLSLVMGMGFQENDAKRALRLNNQDIASSVDFLIEEKAKRAQKRKDDLQRQKEILYVFITKIILVISSLTVVTSNKHT